MRRVWIMGLALGLLTEGCEDEPLFRYPLCQLSKECESGSLCYEGECRPAERTGDVTCSSDAVETTEMLHIPAQKEACAWERNENIALRDGWVTARHEQKMGISLPAGATLCEMRLSLRDADFYYDDQLLLMFNDVVLVSSMDFQQHLPDVDGFEFYEWGAIASTEHATYQEGAFCVQGATECLLPGTQEVGEAALAFSDATNRRLMTIAYGENRAEFKLVITGDNDPDIDCMHSGLHFEVNYRYEPARNN